MALVGKGQLTMGCRHSFLSGGRFRHLDPFQNAEVIIIPASF
jgi:hypothetical protein